MKKLNLVFKKRGKGNIKAQRKRRKARKKLLKPGDYFNDEFELIDGNYSHYPIGYCDRYGRFLTAGLANTHRCRQRKCEKLLSLEQVEQKWNTKFG